MQTKLPVVLTIHDYTLLEHAAHRSTEPRQSLHIGEVLPRIDLAACPSAGRCRFD